MSETKKLELTPECKAVLDNFFRSEAENNDKDFSKSLNRIVAWNNWRKARNKRKQRSRKLRGL